LERVIKLSPKRFILSAVFTFSGTKPMLNRRHLFVTLSLSTVAALTFLSGCATMQAAPATVAETIAANPQLSTLNGLIVKAGLVDTLKGAGPFTVFAPSNAAFAKVPAKTMDMLAANPAQLKSVLTFHVVPGKTMSAAVKNGNVKTVQGANLALSKAGTFVTAEDGLVQTADVVATNGVVHVIDAVLMPPAAR
jgi:uncharacterized surface protein with fasciclin (FAS1) repeats